MSVVNDIVGHGQRWVATPSGAAWLVRRLSTQDLGEQGHAELVGGGDAGAAIREMRERAEAELRNTPPELLEERKQAHRRELWTATVSDPALRGALLTRAAAWCCAAVRAGARIRPPADGETRPAGALDPAVADAWVVDATPLRLVRDEAEHDPAAAVPRIHLTYISEADQILIFGAAQELSSAAAWVRPLRGRT
jgi:hypothetical protein